MTRRWFALPVAAGVAGILAVMVLGPPVDRSSRSGTGAIASFGPSIALARRIITPDFDPTAQLSDNQRHVVASGPIGCDAGERWRVDVTVTQDDAVAEGHDQNECSGAVGRWTVMAVAQGPGAFEPGAAHGCAVFVTRSRGEVTDSHQWCADLNLD